MMQRGAFKMVATTADSPKWDVAIARQAELYQKKDDIRTPFGRDYTRILHSTAYRRLKQKTQVFFSPQSDHISTRIEHVNYVESIASTLCEFLGLNTELARAIAIGHDLGHPPFGHHGEEAIAKLIAEDKDLPNLVYWHEKNGLHFVDNIELLESPDGKKRNLNLTYAVRDGIISHCGEVSDAVLFPREAAIDLKTYLRVNQFPPFTWEGCVVKFADKISYLGRDIEDAIALGILKPTQIKDLNEIVADYVKKHGLTDAGVNNTTIIHLLIMDLCENSQPETGLRFSEEGFKALVDIQKFNIENIYHHNRLNAYKEYGELIIKSIYETLCRFYDGENFRQSIQAYRKQFPLLTTNFESFLMQYWDEAPRKADTLLCNRIIYRFKENPADYKMAAIDYISGMTDSFIEKIFKELIRF